MMDQIKSIIGTFELTSRGAISIALNSIVIEKGDVANALLVIKQLNQGTACNILIDARNYHSISRDAKRYWHESQVFQNAPVVALIVGNRFLKTAANVYASAFQRNKRLRYFVNKSDAFAWFHSVDK
jgi:hypothetical protein